MAVCIDDATIFGHFNRIGQNYEEKALTSHGISEDDL
ncbi:hypothetical protein T12_598 [Trichinella patagoniensis]|uniref:Uncharacterized protein n=1 Tax=Trichinella patagoniensis TaxID=990121 RepID=A0A0V0Z1Q7_9BILA|nr:hypothetical protein T12_598 [Trichinella patagoniensis]